MESYETIWLVAYEPTVKELFTGERVAMSVELYVSDEPPFSQDEDLLQIPVRELILTAWQPHEEMT